MEILILPVFLLSLFGLYSFTIKPDYAVFTLISVSVMNAWFIVPPSIEFGLHLVVLDGVFIILFISALFRIFFFQQIMFTSILWVVFGLILFYSFIFGVKLNGTAAGVDFRGYFFYWAGTLYFMTFSYSKDLLEKIQKYWYMLCLVLLAIVYFRFVAEFLHLPIMETWIKDDPTGVRFRVIKSEYAYLLSVTIVALFLRYLVPNTFKPAKVITILFIIAVLVLQHRSVWAATIISIISVTLIPGIKTTRLFSNLIVIGGLGLILLLPLLYSGQGEIFIESINESADNATHLTTGTFGSRLQGWNQFIDFWPKLPFSSQLLGEPMGSRVAGIRSALHNFYLQILSRVGLIGILSILFFYFKTMFKLYLNAISSSENRIYYALFFMLLLGQLTFYIPYSCQAEHGIILGIAYSLAKRKIEYKTSNQITQNNPYLLKINKKPRLVERKI